MLRFRLKELIADKEFAENRRVTLEEISDATGIHRTTFSKVANQRGYNASAEIIDKLCGFFGVQVSEVVVYVADEPEAKSKD